MSQHKTTKWHCRIRENLHILKCLKAGWIYCWLIVGWCRGGGRSVRCRVNGVGNSRRPLASSFSCFFPTADPPAGEPTATDPPARRQRHRQLPSPTSYSLVAFFGADDGRSTCCGAGDIGCSHHQLLPPHHFAGVGGGGGSARHRVGNIGCSHRPPNSYQALSRRPEKMSRYGGRGKEGWKVEMATGNSPPGVTSASTSPSPWC